MRRIDNSIETNIPESLYLRKLENLYRKGIFEKSHSTNLHMMIVKLGRMPKAKIAKNIVININVSTSFYLS